MQQYDTYERREKLQVSVLSKPEESEHFHQDVELLYILEGNMKLQVGEQETLLESGDIFVVNANRRHSYHASADILYARLSIDYPLLSDIFKTDHIIFWCDSTRDSSEKFDELRKTINQLLNHYLSTRGGVANFGHIALCYQVMDLLSVNFLLRAADKEEQTQTDRFEERISQINNYIRAYYNQPISLKELSEKMFLSHGYLSRFFKKHYGMSFAEYLSNVRLYHAYDELIHTNRSITRIAYNNGFPSVTLFNKDFKRIYGDTPTAVRKRSTQKQPLLVDESSALVGERLEQFLMTEGMKQPAPTDCGMIQAEHVAVENGVINPVWKQTINIGAAEDLLKSEVREHVILLKEALGFRYVRFWNIFSSAMLIDITRNDESYNFTRLDSILDFLLLQGMKPHIELGQKPKRIQQNVHKALVYEPAPAAFETLEQWKRFLNAMMRHLHRRYGRKELDTWRLELWHDEHEAWTEEQQNLYYERFNLTAHIVRQFSSMKIGGCGLRPETGMAANCQFLSGWKRQPYQPDFISIINYAYVKSIEELDVYSKRNSDEACLYHAVLGFREQLKQLEMTNVHLYVTEWDLTVSDRNYINDTCYKGAYIVKNVLEVFRLVDELVYFAGSDRVSEHFDSTEFLHGGTGLITRDGVLKPAGFAFEFLNRVYPYRIGQGSNYLITTDHHQTYGIICHNKKDLNYNYYFTNEDELDKKNTWKYFKDREPLQLRLKLSGLENGMYQIKTCRINEQSGSVLNIWAEMDFDSDLSRNDIKYFRRVCEPKLTIHKYEVTDGLISLEILMEANEIAFVRLMKIN